MAGPARPPVVTESLLERCEFPPSPVACGLSGGPDSSAMVALAVAAGREVVAWHVDHGIRADSTRDADAAREIARRLGAAFELRRVEVAPGPGLEERARSARYGVLPPDVCVGHTADDRAETVLLNLGRGSGLSGVAAPMARVLRPLLRLRRSETVALCRRLDLPVVDDPMNRSVEHARVAIRTRVLPALAEALDRDPVPILVRHADLAAEAMAVIGELAETVDVTDVRKLCSVPRAVAAEAVRRWLARELDLGTAVDRGSIDRVLAVAAGEAIATEIVGGHRVARSRGRLSVGPAETRPPGLG